MTPLLDIQENLLIGLVMPIAVAMILALVGGVVGYRKLTNKVDNGGRGINSFSGEIFVARLLSSLEASTAALDKVANALALLHQHCEETRIDHAKQIEALTILIERSKRS